MAEDNSKERDTAARRVRQCSRLEDVSSDSGEQTGAPSSAGAPVEPFEPGKCLRCRSETRDPLLIFCNDCERGVLVTEELAGDTRIPTGWEDLAKDSEHYREVKGGRTIYYPERLPGERHSVGAPGQPRNGIVDREQIIKMLVGYTAKIRCTLRKGQIEPKRRALQHFRAGMVGVQGVRANAEALASIFEPPVTDTTIRRWWREARPLPRWRDGDPDRIEERAGKTYQVYLLPPKQKMFGNSPKGEEEVFVREQLEAIDARLEAAQIELETARADLRRTVAVVLEHFPDDEKIQTAVDRFLDDALGVAD
jgi:hypothetical protein